MIIPKRQFGVIGWPLAQTLSPLIHNTGFQELGIGAVYLAWPLPPEKLEQFVSAMPLYQAAGCSVTIPHKVAVLPYLDNITEAATLAGAANTLYWRDGQLYGENTDVHGFLAPLADYELDHMDALLLGAGGAARAVAAGLRLQGCRHVRITSPGNQRQYELAQRFGFEPIPWEARYDHAAGLVINATPMGMRGELIGLTPYDFALAPPLVNGLAYDLVYNPLETEFLRQARACGRHTITGLEMFFAQGSAQFRVWTGSPLPRAARLALEDALGASGSDK